MKIEISDGHTCHSEADNIAPNEETAGKLCWEAMCGYWGSELGAFLTLAYAAVEANPLEMDAVGTNAEVRARELIAEAERFVEEFGTTDGTYPK